MHDVSWCLGPTVTTSSKIVIRAGTGAGAACRLLTNTEKLLLHTVPVDKLKFPAATRRALPRMAGNCQDVQSIAVAIVLAVSMLNWKNARLGQPKTAQAKAKKRTVAETIPIWSWSAKKRRLLVQKTRTAHVKKQ